MLFFLSLPLPLSPSLSFAASVPDGGTWCSALRICAGALWRLLLIDGVQKEAHRRR